MTLAAGAIAAALLLPAPLAAAITWLNIAGVLARGVLAASRGKLKTDVLDALAIGVPAARQEYVTASVTRFLLALAEHIEATTVQQSDELLRSLLRQAPGDVWVERHDGELARMPFMQLKGGERVVVGAGETIPVDGQVVAGDAYVDQSSVTGESLPMPRAVGDQALAGGVVTDGRLVVQAERVGEDYDDRDASRAISRKRSTVRRRSRLCPASLRIGASALRWPRLQWCSRSRATGAGSNPSSWSTIPAP